MAELTIRESLTKALKEALDNNDNVFLMGEDIGMYGGPYAVTKGLLEEYGSEKIMDTPISESGFVGAAIGASMAGMKPIVEIMTINFSLLAIDQIVNHAAKIHYMSDGQISVPIIIRTVTGAGGRLGATHSQSFEGWYASVPGLKVVCPSNAIDALGLLDLLLMRIILLFLWNIRCCTVLKMKYLINIMKHQSGSLKFWKKVKT